MAVVFKLVGVLSGELFEKDEEAYGQTALDLVQSAGTGALPPMPQMGKDASLALVSRVTDGKILGKYGDSLAEAVGVSYQLTTTEAWDDLDPARAAAEIHSGLEAVRQQHKIGRASCRERV